MTTPLQLFIDGARTAGPGSEVCGPEEQLGPGEISQRVLHGDANRLPRTAHDPLIQGAGPPHTCASELSQPARRVVGSLEIQHNPTPASGEGPGAVGNDLATLRQQRVRVGGEDRVDAGRELELGGVGLHEADIAPAVGLDPTLSLGEHGVCQVNADDPALGTDLLLDQWKVEARAAADLDHAVTRAKPERLYGPAAVGALGVVEP